MIRLICLLAIAATSAIPAAAQPKAPPDCPPCGACVAAIPATQPAVASAETRQNLLDMRREEKLAHDVYVALGEAWNLRPFKHIQQAEIRHGEAVALLMKQYDVADTTSDLPAGKFDSADVQKLYDDFITRGKTSADAALAVGAEIEELDIVDLRNCIAKTAEADVKVVLVNLEQASHNHLRAFVRTLNARGVEYTPKHLPAADYHAIIKDESAGGARGAGMSRQNRGVPRWARR